MSASPDPERLWHKIGEAGDALWKGRFPERNGEHPIPLDELGLPGWSLLYQTSQLVDRLANKDKTPLELVLFGFLCLLIPAWFALFLVVDLVHLPVRFLLYPLVLAAWWGEKRLALLLGRRIFCPICHQVMDDPWVYCPNPRCPQPVQARLRPRFHSLFLRTCSTCGRGRWLLLGQRFLFRPRHLVCRHTDTVSGCFHPIRLPALQGGNRLTNLAIVGTSTRAKHALMAHLFHQLTSEELDGQEFEPAWNLTELELLLCRTALFQAFQTDTKKYEMPGKRYSLCWAFLLQARGRKQLVAFHNMVNRWFQQTEKLAEKGANWARVNGLLLLLDPVAMGKKNPPGRLPQMEYYARLVRVVEEFCDLRPGSTLPFPVAVLLGVPPNQASQFGQTVFPLDGLSSEETEEIIRRHDPALLGLLRRTVEPDRLGFFSGVLPPQLNTSETLWMRQAVNWLIR